MKKQLWMGLSVMLLAALVLGACGTPATEAPAPVEPQPLVAYIEQIDRGRAEAMR